MSQVAGPAGLRHSVRERFPRSQATAKPDVERLVEDCRVAQHWKAKITFAATCWRVDWMKHGISFPAHRSRRSETTRDGGGGRSKVEGLKSKVEKLLIFQC